MMRQDLRKYQFKTENKKDKLEVIALVLHKVNAKEKL